MSRRVFCIKPVFISLWLLLGVSMISPGISLGGEQADRAIAAVRKLVEEGQVPKDAVLRVVAKQGNVANFWGKDLTLKAEWETQTGTRLDVSTMPQQPLLNFMKEKRDFDISVARQQEYPDLFTEGLIADLTPLFSTFGLKWDANPSSGYYLLKAQTEFDQKIVAVPADGDIAILYLRKDLLDDADNRRRYQSRYKRNLQIPKTWQEYQRQIEFFYDPARGFYGSCEEREPTTGWMFWMPRYLSQSSPVRYLFDENMHPLIDSPEGVAATKSYLAVLPYSPADILKEGNNYSYTVPIFKRGDCYANMMTPAGAKINSVPMSPIRDKFTTVAMPGTLIGGQLVSRPSFIYGNNIVVAASSKQKELAFLYAMWLTDPDVSLRSVLVVGGFADPYRFNHYKDEAAKQVYTSQGLDAMEKQLVNAVPAGTGLPGDNDYIQALSLNLWRAGRGDFGAEEAMKKTAAEWEAITERHGREKQKKYWKQFKEKFPTATLSMTQD